MFPAFCALFRSNTIRTHINLNTDLEGITPKIAQRMLEGASHADRIHSICVAIFSGIFVGLGALLIKDCMTQPHPDQEHNSRLTVGILTVAFAVLFATAYYHNYRHYQAVYLSKLHPIAAQGTLS